MEDGFGLESGEVVALLDMEFLKKASSLKLWDKDRSVQSPMTVFVPQQYAGGEKLFEELWRRHTVPGIVKIGSIGVQQLTTNAKLAYALYASPDAPTQHFFGGARVASCNIQYNGWMFHTIAAAALPDLRPIPGCMSRVRSAYVAGEVIELTYMASGIDPVQELGNFSLFVTLTKENREHLAKIQNMSWYGNGTPCNILIPNVDAPEYAMVWIALYDNSLRHPIITTAVRWLIKILPNPGMLSNPVITAVNPRVGVVNTELWILGTGFSSRPTVTFGMQVAQVICSTSSLIRCNIPPGKGNVPIWVANGPLYTRFDGSFTYASCSQ